MKLIKLKSGDIAIIGNSKIKDGDYFVELSFKESPFKFRQSYTGIIYKCLSKSANGNFIFTQEINFPFPENCRKVIYSTAHFKSDWSIIKRFSKVLILGTIILAIITVIYATQLAPISSNKVVLIPISLYLIWVILSIFFILKRHKK